MAKIPGVAAAKNTARTVFAHPLAFFLFGMLFAAFLFPMVSSALGRFKASNPTLGKVIPGAFAQGA